jgi:hypothetical protein
MRQKLIVFSILAVVGLAVLAVAGVTVYALGFGQNEVIVQPEKVEAAPVQAAPAVIQAEQVKYEGHSYGAGGGCSHAAKMQMTYKADKADETSEEPLLTQVAQR